MQILNYKTTLNADKKQMTQSKYKLYPNNSIDHKVN